MPKYVDQATKTCSLGLTALGAACLFFAPASSHALVVEYSAGEANKDKEKGHEKSKGHKKGHHDFATSHSKNKQKDHRKNHPKELAKENGKAKHGGPPGHAGSHTRAIGSNGKYSGKPSVPSEETKSGSDDHLRYAASSSAAKQNKELRKHLKHLAQISRLAAIATERKNDSLQKKIEMLRSKEDKRHHKVLARLVDRTDPIPGHVKNQHEDQPSNKADAHPGKSKKNPKSKHAAKHAAKNSVGGKQ